ncbi:helix-turn-helix domain-containing protein [Paenibacillus sp. GCM10012307]|uniref:helix-turn-helix domain-containing protein n=1 Tax=Paenibacillus TaxID=44249 RepID=UPI002FCE4278
MPELLESRKWTQRQLADKAGISEQAVSHYVNDRRKRIPLDIAIPLADAFNVHPRELVEWADG